MSDESRKAFESWARKSRFSFDLDTDSDDEYCDDDAGYAWQGWSARDAEIAALKARVGELDRKMNYWRDKAKDALR